ncbi:MAG: T9SS type A sorting domain-containing protein [Bacteroidetes bacterium]|nr:T9SS type A sorting domain-containing protein [Bacteroidota bacterium]
MTDSSNKLPSFVLTAGICIVCQFTNVYCQVSFNDKTYPYGIKPSPALSSTATTEYNKWKTAFVTSTNAGGFQRVMYQQSSNFTYTASEGIGYGMLLAAYHADQSLFDDLFGFLQLHKNKRGLMCWNIPYSGVTPLDGSGEYNSATDADEDIAFSLIIADIQWGSSGNIDYKNEASAIIDSLYKYCVDPISGLLKPGDVYGDSSCLNPSYFAISYYPHFAALSLNNGWNTVRSKCVQILDTASALNSTGLIGDWSDQYGGLPASCSWRSSEYEYDASRITWRVGLDFLWNGNPDSKLICQKIINWTLTSPINGNASVITDGYYKTGAQKSSNKNNPIIAGFQTGAMTTTEGTWLNNLYNQNLLREDDWFYNRTVKVLSLFVASGNFWSPAGVISVPQNSNDEISFNLYPNPASGKFNLISRYIVIQIEIYNVLGEKVYEEAPTLKGAHTFSVSLFSPGLGQGIYFIKVRTEKELFSQKIIF